MKVIVETKRAVGLTTKEQQQQKVAMPKIMLYQVFDSLWDCVLLN